jgi:hypothetical protein
MLSPFSAQHLQLKIQSRHGGTSLCLKALFVQTLPVPVQERKESHIDKPRGIDKQKWAQNMLPGIGIGNNPRHAPDTNKDFENKNCIYR